MTTKVGPRKWQIHHNSGPPPSTQLVQEFLAKYNTLQVRQPPFSTDVSLYDFSMFSQL